MLGKDLCLGKTSGANYERLIGTKLCESCFRTGGGKKIMENVEGPQAQNRAQSILLCMYIQKDVSPYSNENLIKPYK